MTTGGRTVNKRPFEYYLNFIADIDISGAYGSQFLEFYFPVGRPRILAKTHNTLNSNQMNLGFFMRKYEKDLKKYKMFKVIVSETLSFEQD